MEIVKATVAADLIIEYDDGSIVLIKRANEPYRDMWALPGGIMDDGETIEQTAVREAKEETGLNVKLIKMIGVYSDPGKDPRGRTVSVLFSAKVTGGKLKANSDARDTLVTNEYLQIKLAFDHNQMLFDYINGVKRI